MTPVFSDHKLGSPWKRANDDDTYVLRRMTNGKTLEGSYYFWSPYSDKKVYNPNPEEWSPVKEE